jgi:hypothetical protein
MIAIGSSWDPFERIRETVDNLRYLDSLNEFETARFAKCDFARPVSIVPLAMTGLGKSLQFSNIPEYLQNIDFPFGEEIDGYTHDGETYFPLTRADLDKLNNEHRELKLRNLSDKYASLLQRNIDEDQEFVRRLGKNVSTLLISEMIDNIYEHSNASNSFIFSQYWSSNNSCEICLADNGIGIFQSLLNAGRNVENEHDAMEKVINEYLSSKDEFGSSNRGTGIKNTIKVLSNNELNGYFCVISNNAGYYIDNEQDHFLDLQNISLNGTMIDMGFKKPATNFNMYDYIF